MCFLCFFVLFVRAKSFCKKKKFKAALITSFILLLQSSDGSICNFRISCQSLTKENYHDCRTIDEIEMKLGPVTKIGKRNRVTSKSSDNDIIKANYDVIVIFLIYDQFGAIRKLISRRIVSKSYASIILRYFFILKKEYKISNTALTRMLWVNTVFFAKKG